MSILKRGLSGDPVRVLQTKLGVTADGIFGPGTDTALRDYQKKHGLLVDGVAGPDTFVQMGLYELVLLAPGTVGESVKKLQQALGVTADGIFGHGTQKALRDFQAKNGLDVDGFAGPATLAKMSGFKEMTAEIIKKSEAGHGPATAPAGATPGATHTASATPPASAAPGTTHTADATPPAPTKSIWERLFGHKTT
jgi:peptidoglycan hydrolase-like protein with peptidoglycan-binding domain